MLSVSKFLPGKKEENCWRIFRRWGRMVEATKRPEQKNASTEEVADYTPDFNKIIGNFSHRLRPVREPGGSERENKVFEIDNELSKWSFGSVAEMLFDKRFGCLEEEINKEAQTFIKAVGDFLANAVEVGFLPSWFDKIYVNQKRIKFFENFDTMYD